MCDSQPKKNKIGGEKKRKKPQSHGCLAGNTF